MSVKVETSLITNGRHGPGCFGPHPVVFAGGAAYLNDTDTGRLWFFRRRPDRYTLTTGATTPQTHLDTVAAILGENVQHVGGGVDQHWT